MEQFNNVVSKESISKTRFNLVSNDLTNYQLTEKNAIFYYKTGSVDLNKPLATDMVETTVRHNLGYIPAFQVFSTRIVPTVTNEYHSIPFQETYSGSFNLIISASINTKVLTLKIEMYDPLGIVSTPNYTESFKYYILKTKL